MRFRRKRRDRANTWVPDHDEDGYRGPAQLTVGEATIDVEVTLAGHLEPLDGRYHWYGRATQHDDLDAAKRNGATAAQVAIPGGPVTEARLAEHDAWGNVRLTGVGTPPFDLPPVEVTHERW